MLSVCTPSHSGRCVYSLVLNAFLGLCLNNSFIYTLKLNYTLSILLHVTQPSSIQIKHRCSEITFLTSPWYCITCQLEVRILYLSQKYMVIFTKDHYGIERWIRKLLLSSLCGIGLFFLKPRDIIAILSHYFVSGLKGKYVCFRNLFISVFWMQQDTSLLHCTVEAEQQRYVMQYLMVQ